MQPIRPSELVQRWLLAAACFAVLIFFFSPSWAAFDLWSRVPEMGGMLEVRRGVSVLGQMEHPGARIADPLHEAIQWRLLFPVIGHVLRLPADLFFALADLGCVLVLGFVIARLRERGASCGQAAAGALIAGSAEWFFASTGWLGYFDAWVVLGLSMVAFARTSWAVWFACLWAPWIDERFVLGAPLALACRFALTEDASARRKELGIAGPLLVAFVVVRLAVLPRFSGAGATPGGYLRALDLHDASLSRVLFGLWEGLRAGWIFVVAAVAFLARRRRAAAAVVAVFAVALAIVGVRTAQDFGRSMLLLSPVVILGLLLAQETAVPRARQALIGAVAIGLLLPAHHVMSDRVTPIYYLYHELAAFDSPPPGAMPELYELKAIREMQGGQFGDAENDLTLAVKLARNPAEPARQRGVLRASQGRWPDARDDFALAAKSDPQDPEAWFLGAQAELAMGNSAAAGRNFAQALSVAPAGWSSRPDVQRFQARLAAQR